MEKAEKQALKVKSRLMSSNELAKETVMWFDRWAHTDKPATVEMEHFVILQMEWLRKQNVK